MPLMSRTPLPKKTEDSADQGQGEKGANSLHTLAAIQVMCFSLGGPWEIFCPEMQPAQLPLQLLREQTGRGISLLTPLTLSTCGTAAYSLVEENKD